MNLLNVTIDGIKVQVPEGTSVLDAAKLANVDIPTLCYLKDINEIGACRMCLVDVGGRALQAACVYPCSEGLKVITNSPKIRDIRKATLELILSHHDRSCLTCIRNQNCELQALADKLNVRDIPFDGAPKGLPIDNISKSIVRDNNKCVLCRRCTSICNNIQTVGAINVMERGYETVVSTTDHRSIADVNCVNCGQCINVCPVGAIYEKDNTQAVWDAIKDPDKYVVIQTAPSVRAGIGEEFGYPIGTPVTGKMVGAIKKMGFDKVFDTDTAADLTIMEEGTELLTRIKTGGKLPLITSCSPGWIKFCEHEFPEFLDNLSTCKSPQQMFGALIKSYYAEKNNIDPSKIFVVAVMPCTAKKFESDREEMFNDVDVSITSRELARMIREAGIDFRSVEEAQFDNPLGEATGAGVIFGATGGVMEAALRTVYYILEGKRINEEALMPIRGTEGIKEATLKVAGMDVNVCAASGLGNARKVLNMVKNGEKNYHFIEIMACPGGCVNGGGQPIVPASIRNKIDIRAERAKALYSEDKRATYRNSDENPFIQKFYKEYAGEPGSHKAHELLHTHYQKREKHLKNK
ncbi:MAG TPA: NADH-dependent [FeFe] hydrogenase, group A6 [Clostridia bacterium]|jgi:NADP-reducing hydrogenase subunit HndD|nr:2Fe-2S iron-sulfur cluster binding domain-containing protein [Clostridiaceae bacterium]HOF25880.1 NADH-dependent [FeFe] hydrogenase, group A6 [Clostridia bacterium]HOM33677.1 NADH-dependent [FeFe] hydrogenase, group A6 [Clostridia bacterium]HOR88905.1 NADH-dependent [FeFe] hydrogenase, group A6 [Clostridia bacterium]HOT71039.1 NADH-dependent [FeFe] hydrogenase, group A6 [Clostridia bacterium]